MSTVVFELTVQFFISKKIDGKPSPICKGFIVLSITLAENGKSFMPRHALNNSL